MDATEESSAAVDVPALTPEEIAANREVRRKAKKEAKKVAKGSLNTVSAVDLDKLEALYGDATASFAPVPTDRPIRAINLSEVRDLVLFMFDESPTPNWTMLKNKALIGNILLLFVRGYGYAQYALDKADGQDPAALSTFSAAHVLPLRMERGRWNAVAHDVKAADYSLLHIHQQRKVATKQHASVPPNSPEQLLERLYDVSLRLEELRAHDFPVPVDGVVPAGYVMTRTAKFDFEKAEHGDCCVKYMEGRTNHPRLLAVDCEMCQTAAGSQLARVTIINQDGETLMDEFVLPELPILDYLTQYSGVTPELLAHATLTLKDVQAKVIDIIDGVNTADSTDDGHCCLHPGYLVGHSLDSDLHALKLIHTRLIDTSIAYPHPAGLPCRHSLRHLCRVYLFREIQAGHGCTGHCSAEDALAALHLITRVLYGAELEDLEEDAPPAKRPKLSSIPEELDSTATRARVMLHAGAYTGMAKEIHGEGRFSHLPAAMSEKDAPLVAGTGKPASLGELVHALRQEPSATAAGAVPEEHSSGVPEDRSANQKGQSTWRRQNWLDLPMFNDSSRCAGISIIGCQSFVRAHLVGRASGLHTSVSASSSDRCHNLRLCAKELHKLDQVRKAPGKGAVKGVVIAELSLADGKCRDTMAQLNDDIASVADSLPKNTAIVTVFQNDVKATIDESIISRIDKSDMGFISSGNPSLYGVLALHVLGNAHPSMASK